MMTLARDNWTGGQLMLFCVVEVMFVSALVGLFVDGF